MIPFVSPRTNVMAPDMGTHSMHQGHSVNEIVVRKGGSRRAAEVWLA